MNSQSKIDKKTIQKIAGLAQLSLTEKEEELYTEQLAGILDYMSELAKVDTTGIEPMVTAVAMEVTLREDEPRAILTPEEVLANSPDRMGNLFKVPPVL